MFAADRTLVMGIVNVTPDSFSDGGSYVDSDAAISRAYALVREGADIVDIGGESTRPGATPLSSREEWRRIGAVVRELCKAGVAVSVDTYHADTARRAADAGAAIINDVTGGHGDPSMLSAIASSRCTYVLQHGRGNAQTMNSRATYADVAAEVADELKASIDRALSAGIAASRIVVDPGFGFAKVGPNDWDLAAHMEGVMGLGFPVLVGVSRKRFLAEIAAGAEGPTRRDDATAALTAYFAELGVWAVRVHEVAASRAAVETVARLREAGANVGVAGAGVGEGDEARGAADASGGTEEAGAADADAGSDGSDAAREAGEGSGAGVGEGADEAGGGGGAADADAGSDGSDATGEEQGAGNSSVPLAAQPGAAGGVAQPGAAGGVVQAGAGAGDIVRIAGVRAEGCHGVYAEEKSRPQPFVVDVEAEIEPARAAASDHVGDTISYSEIAADAVEAVAGAPVDLIETLAERVADRVLARGALRVAVTVHKPEAPMGISFSDASVTIRRCGPLTASGTARRVILSLGSNLGDRHATLDAAVEQIRALDVCVSAVSDYVVTSPVLAPGQDPQPDYLNAVLSLTTAMAPLDLLDTLQRIEIRLGRVRGERWAPRTIDLDVIDIEGVTSGNPRLTLPHPRAAKRGFVLAPWLGIEPGATLSGTPVATLLAEFESGESGCD
ncbi:MAG: dihydropteroate synthase [Actinomycetaceae bacterium]|nr:dihydropteroate synthase [Actinomycetaceae bacterium]